MKEQKLTHKQAVIAEIKEKIENSQALVLVDYRGLNVEQINELRTKYREAGVEYKVYKNTMMRFAFNELGYEGMDEFLAGPSAVAFSMEDPVSAAKVTRNFAKDHEHLVIKSGVVDGNVIGVDAVVELADLPSREELVARALAGFNSPLQGFANVLNGTIKGLVVALNAIAEQKAQEA